MLSWSHAVLYVQTLQPMLQFYSEVLGFLITDRGPLAEGAPEIVFLSQDPSEHHQLAMVATRQDTKPSNSVNHFAFRVAGFKTLQGFHETLKAVSGITVNPFSHGNTLSLYFNDPEGNGIEIFWETPWHVAQPQGKPWDPNLAEADAWLGCKKRLATIQVSSPARTIKPEDGQQQSNDSIWCLISFKR